MSAGLRGCLWVAGLTHAAIWLAYHAGLARFFAPAPAFVRLRLLPWTAASARRAAPVAGSRARTRIRGLSRAEAEDVLRWLTSEGRSCAEVAYQSGQGYTIAFR